MQGFEGLRVKGLRVKGSRVLGFEGLEFRVQGLALRD